MVDFDENVGLVYYVFNKFYQNYRNIEDDLIQEGLMGLWKACQTFDSLRGTEFSTYATVVIKYAMCMYVRKIDRRPKEYSLDRLVDKDESGMTFLNLVPHEEQEDPRDVYIIEVLMKVAKENNCEEIVKMKLEGIKQVDIAKELGLHQSTISEKMRHLYMLARKELGIEE